MDHFTSVNSLIENLRAEDPELRLTSMRGIHVIAQTIGPERTKSELLPYLTDYLDESDDVLRVFANALGTMLPDVGGVQHASSLLQPLELLAGLDEITVREEAVASMALVMEAIFRAEAAANIQQEVVTLLQRLTKSDLPQTRSSACSLLHVPYPYVAVSVKTALRQAFHKLCTDDEIMVRRSACVALGKHFAKTLGQQASDVLTPFASFCRDASDGVRLQAVTTAIVMLSVLPDAGISQVVSLLKSLSSDSSWRVRYMVADRLGDICRAFGASDVQKVCVPIFKTLCQDSEPEVRAAVVFNMAQVLTCLSDGPAKKEAVLVGHRLAGDQNSHVRMSLASAILKSAVCVNKELWTTTSFPTINRLIQDQESDVRLALVTGFASMGTTTESKELAPKLVPVVTALATDPKWRVREVVIGQIPFIVNSLGKSADEVLDVCLKALEDRVASIRASGCDSCCRLVQENGSAWAETSLFPKLVPLANGESFLRRVTFLQLVTGLARVAALESKTVQKSISGLLSNLVGDRVANVRVNAAKALIALRDNGKMTRGDADASLARLLNDPDADVRGAASAK